jgi:hypothetical protein
VSGVGRVYLLASACSLDQLIAPRWVRDSRNDRPRIAAFSHRLNVIYGGIWQDIVFPEINGCSNAPTSRASSDWVDPPQITVIPEGGSAATDEPGPSAPSPDRAELGPASPLRFATLRAG